MSARRATSASRPSPPTSSSRAVADARDAAALTEGRDRRDPHVLVLARVARRARAAARVAIAGRTRPSVSTSRARAPGSRTPSSAVSRPTASALGRRRRPLLERALREHPGEAAGGDLADEAADRVEARQPGTERPRGVLADGPPVIGEQRGQHARRLLVEDLGERVHRGDRGDLVVAVQRRGQHPQRAHARIAAGLEGEVVGEADRLDDAGRVAHRIQCRLHAHVASRPRPPRRAARSNRSPPGWTVGWASVNGFTPNIVRSFMRVVAIGDVGVVDDMMHIGDEAMFEAARDELAARGADVVGVSSAPAETAARYGIEAVARIGFDGLDRDAAEARLAAVLALADGRDRLSTGGRRRARSSRPSRQPTAW